MKFDLKVSFCVKKQTKQNKAIYMYKVELTEEIPDSK